MDLIDFIREDRCDSRTRPWPISGHGPKLSVGGGELRGRRPYAANEASLEWLRGNQSGDCRYLDSGKAVSRSADLGWLALVWILEANAVRVRFGAERSR